VPPASPPDGPATAPERPQAALPPPQRVVVLFVGRKPLKRRLEPPSMRFDADHMRPLGKPHGGLWTCRELPEFPGYTPWLESGAYRVVGGRRDAIWRITAPAARLLTIDTSADLGAAFERYPADFLEAINLRAILPPDQWAATQMPELDHAAIAADGYDGLEVTARGLHAPFEGSSAHWNVWWPLALTGYDVPTILWYRWAFRGRPERVPGQPVDDPDA
jgi:hypothetical protein